MIRAFVVFMATPAPITGPINLGNPVEFSILELAEKIIQLTGTKSEIIFQPLPEDDPMQRKPDVSMAREKLDWSPEIDLEEGLSHTIKYFQKDFR
jgi:UDP-glucuronate decarboxylase